MSSLKDKLKRIKIEQAGAGETPEKSRNEVRERLERLVDRKLKHHQPLKFKEENREKLLKKSNQEDRTFLEKEYFYPDYLRFRELSIALWEKVDLKNLGLIFPQRNCNDLCPEELLFFDTETTGLAGGTGTIPFIYGFGFLNENGFQIKVFTLLDLSAENEFLEKIAAFLRERSFRALVTYNGNTFDLPLVRNRAILNRRSELFKGLISLDFLPVSRRFWKRCFDSCKLGYLGEMILGLSREDDLPGAMIPVYYNNFLQTGDLHFIERIIEHNSFDLLELALLLLKVLCYFQDQNSIDHASVALAKAYSYLRYNLFDQAEEAFHLADELSTEDELRRQARKELALLFKRKKLIAEAVAIWEELVVSFDPEVIHQLCVHLEHKRGDYQRALELSEQMLQNLTLPPGQRERWQKRMARLKQKLQVTEKRLSSEEIIFSERESAENGN